MPVRRRGGRPARRLYDQPELVLLPPIEVPLDAEHRRQALIALAELLAPLFGAERLGVGPPPRGGTGPKDNGRPPAPGGLPVALTARRDGGLLEDPSTERAAKDDHR